MIPFKGSKMQAFPDHEQVFFFFIVKTLSGSLDVKHWIKLKSSVLSTKI